MEMNDILRKFAAGETSPQELRDELKKEVKKSGVTLNQLQQKTRFNTSSPEITADAVETGVFLQNLYKAKKGDFGAAKILEDWSGKSTLIEGTDNLGGYMVPDELENSLIKFIEGASVLMPHCRQFTMNSDTKNIPVLDGNVTATFHSEGSGISETNPSFANAKLTAYRQDAYSKVSNELLDDSNIEIIDMLLSQFTEQMGQGLDNVILNGTGNEASAGFSGVFTAAVGYSTVMDNVAFSSILVSNMVELYHQVPSYAREKGIFVMHSDVAKYLQLEKDNNGAYRWNPYGVPDMKIHGKYPIIETIKAPDDDDNAVDTAFVMFGNFKYLAVGLRKGLSLLVDPYSRAEQYESRIVMVRRLALAYLKNSAFSRLLTAAS